MDFSLVIPAYNERASLPKCLEEAKQALQGLSLTYEIIIVDDGSTDGTWEELERITAQSVTKYAFRALRFSRNFGKEAAIAAGLQVSCGKATCVMDADLQHPPTLIPKMIELWRKGYLIVEAEKEVRSSEAFNRRVGTYYFHRVFEKSTNFDLKHATDFKLLDRIVLDRYLTLPERNRFFKGLTAWLGYPRATVTFVPPERDSGSGSSRWSFCRLFIMGWNSLIGFSSLPLHLITWLGLVSLLGSIILGIHTLLQKFFWQAAEGFATTILLQLFIGSALMFSLGLIGEYLARIFEEIKGRPMYIILDTIESRPEAPTITHTLPDQTGK